jgi:transcription initiation factor TFIIB
MASDDGLQDSPPFLLQQVYEDDPDDELWALFAEHAVDAPPPENDACCNPACRAHTVILDDSNYVCSTCSTVQGRFLDASAEWRHFNGADGCAVTKDPSRVGMPTNDMMPEGSMSTQVGGATSSKGYRDMSRISKYQMWTCMPYRERSLYKAIDHLNVRAVNSGINQSIIDEAKMLYKRLTELHVSRGENRVGLLASSIYVACKNNRVPRSAREIADMFDLDVGIITRNCKVMQEMLHLSLSPSSPADYVHRFCSQLDLDQNVRDACAELVSKIEECGAMHDSSPTSTVSGAIAFVCRKSHVNVTRKAVASVCGVSVVTVAKCEKKVRAFYVDVAVSETA